ncbi:unnamed protein product [Closterium sp. NIES-64]|nr:unnamed protein product [Closterium sp. NIES-64]
MVAALSPPTHHSSSFNPPVSAKPRQLVIMARFTVLTALVLLLAVTITLASFVSTAAARPVRLLLPNCNGMTSDGATTCMNVKFMNARKGGHCNWQKDEPVDVCQAKLDRWNKDCEGNSVDMPFWALFSKKKRCN